MKEFLNTPTSVIQNKFEKLKAVLPHRTFYGIDNTNVS